MSVQSNKQKMFDTSEKYTQFKYSKKLEKWNFTIFTKKLQTLDDRAKAKKEQSFLELYEAKRMTFQKQIHSFFKFNEFF